ncbi:cytochrome b5 [Fusarium flagelliforme]|uniref:Cytochrome b5 n=1 Tax=Fusarium flagelliforme TaxID=2675880 RepID=A0A395MTV7_9HYPO|nr:cytochrome b5 [Fusarium flagelliforme]
MAGKFEPKVPINLDPPKDDVISKEELARANGATEGGKCYVAIKVSHCTSASQDATHCATHLIQESTTDRLSPQGKVYDVTGNKAYLPGASYNVFAGKDASRALAKSSTKPEDALPEWKDLDDKEKGVLNDWITFFSKRYNIVGVVEGATNME